MAEDLEPVGFSDLVKDGPEHSLAMVTYTGLGNSGVNDIVISSVQTNNSFATLSEEMNTSLMDKEGSTSQGSKSGDKGFVISDDPKVVTGN